MIEDWLQGLSDLLGQNLWLGLLIALVAGVLTSFTPCSLASVPLIVGYVSGYSQDRKKAFYYSLMFCLGMAITFTMLGVVAVLVGRIFLAVQMYWYIFLGALMALMALQMWEVIDILPRSCGQNPSKRKGAIGAVSLGIVGAIFSSPCSTPVLIAIMVIISTGESMAMGVLMLLMYSLGHSVLILVAGTSVGWVNEISRSERFQRTGGLMKNIMGGLLFLLSMYLFYSAFI